MNQPSSLSVFHIDGEKPFRGGERQLLDLAKGLRRLGHRNTIVCRRGSALDSEARRCGFPVLYLPFLGEWDLYSALLLAKEARRSASGLPILHSHTGHSTGVARLAGLFCSCIHVAHRSVDFPIASKPSLWWKYLPADRIIAISRATKEVLLQDGVPEEKIKVVHAGVDVEEMSSLVREERDGVRRVLSRESGVEADADWIVNLAALAEHKDQSTLLKAMALVVRRRPQSRLFIIGEGELEEKLKRQCAELSLQEKVRFLGFRKNPLALLKAMDLFVLSSCGEGLGIVLLEAMFCGLPVVATRVGGIPEIVEEGSTGFLVPARDPEALSGEILRVLKDKELARSLAENGRKRVAQFSFETMSKRVEEVYLAALRARGGRS